MLFGALHTSASGLTLFRTWMDAVSDNIANANTVRPGSAEAFRARFVIAQSQETGDVRGVRVGGIALGSGEGRLVHEPDHPMADENGMVRYPDVDMGDQMTQLIVAQRGYQMNLAVIDRAKDTYQQALTIGR